MRVIRLSLLAIALSGCATEQIDRRPQFHRDPRVHRNPEFYNTYRPPTEINGHEFGSSVLALPERAQLVGGGGFEYYLRDKDGGIGREFDVNYTDYFVPGDTSPFAPPARVSSIEYLYCMIGDAPGLCGSKIVYESEEVYQTKDVLSQIRNTNHELIVDQLLAKHGRPEYSEKYTQTVIEEPGAIHRGPISQTQRRVWCDFSMGVPKKCKRSIIALFTAFTGRGVIIYIDEKMYHYLQWFELDLKHQHPVIEIIRGENKYLNAEEKAWWEARPTQSSLKGYLPSERLHTEMQLEARAKESGKPRVKIARGMTHEEYAQGSVSSYVNPRVLVATGEQQNYWYGYEEGNLTRYFDRQFHLTDEAHKKWTGSAQDRNSEVGYGGRGYTDALSGTRSPPKGYGPISSSTSSPPKVSNACEKKGLNAWQRLKCALKRQ